MKESRVSEFIKNPRKALFILAGPLVVGMLVQTLYNIVDTAFVGRLGADSIAALTFSFPLFFVLMALNSGIATGMGSRIARYLGEKNKAAAENTALHGLIISIILAIIIFIPGIIFLRPIFSLFGATNTVLELAISYMLFILLGIFFMFPAFVINGIFSAQGDTKTPMKVMILSLILNIILDPIFIYALKQGVRGAAIATLIAFLFSLILYIYYLRKKSYLRLHLKNFKFSFPICKDICRVGAPASIMMLLMSVSYIFFNRFVAHFGTNFIAAYGVVIRLESLAVMPMVAWSTAMMTLAGMFFGAKRYDLLKSTTWYAVRIGLWFTSIIALILFLVPSLFFQIFTPDQYLIDIGTAFIRVMVFTLPLMAIGMPIARTLQGMGLGLPALVFNLVRLIIVAVPVAYIFIFILGFGFLSVPLATIIGGIIGDSVAAVWYKLKIKKLNTS
ncbi:hypothetical protein AYK26_06155 [Euryarchaeota archaeon SM23-78]|nr:MAG: hypothetical protein AYK26_06155 [Euryarchaeota archaeon SM23-78]MBW3001209.1 MATE family efflux transporter [Candidatus Woesearchaeota archaeon]